MKVDTGKKLNRAALIETRQARGLTQLQLATLTGRTDAALSLIETGAKKPSYRWVVEIAAALGVDPDDLLIDEAS